MEEYSQLENVTGSPTAGESGFVHVESIDSASMDGSAINQDDGVVVTRVNNVQDDSSDLRMTDDVNEEFVDCPDDLLSIDGKTEFDESQDSEVVSEVNQHTILPHHYQEERQQLMTELNNLRDKLKLLIKKHPLIDGKEGDLFTYELATERVTSDDMDKSLWPLHEVIFDCSRFIELASSEQSQTEHTVKELLTTLDTKDKEINALNVKLTEHISVETTTNRILNTLGMNMEEFPNASFSGKMLNLEKGVSFLVENRNHFFSEVEMHKRKEVELINKSSRLENEYKKLMEHFEKSRETIKTLNSEIVRLKGESEVDKSRYSNTREKLNMAVTKGKSLVQQRDSLKQQVVEKSSELDKCLVDLQEKSSLVNSLQDEVYRMKEDASVKIDSLIVSLVMETQEKKYLEDEFANLTQKFEEVCVLKEKNVALKIDLQRSEDKGALLREKLSMAVKKGKGLVQEREILKQQIAEKNLHIETLNLELKQQEDHISKLSSDVQMITKLEFDLLHSKEEKDQIEKFLVESNTLLERVIDATNEIVLPNDVNDPVEKVKLCATFLNECQVLKAQVEKELKDVKDEALKTTKSLEDAEKSVSELTEEKSKLEDVKNLFEEELQESWRSIKSLEETMSQLQTNNKTAQNNINLLESEMKKFKDEALKTTKSLEDALSVSEKNVSQLTEEKSKLENVKTHIEEELQESCKTIKSLEDTVSQLQTHVSHFSNENETSQNNIESEMKKLKDEVSYHENKFMDASETIKTLEDSLLKADNNVSKLIGEKNNTEHEITTLNMQLSVCRKELDLSKKILTDEFIRFSTFIEDLVTSLLIKLEGIKNSVPVTIQQAKSLQKNVNDLEIDKEIHEKKIITMSTTIKELRAELDEIRSTYEKVKEENDMLQNRVFKVETDLEASQTIRDEMVIKLKDYQGKEDEWKQLKDHEENKLLIMSTTIEELQAELDETKSTYEKVKEENVMLQNRVSNVETEYQTMRDEMVIKLQDYQAKEAELYKQLKDNEGENKRGVTEASSQSEISEVEDQVSIGKRSLSLRKGSNDHFALNIEPETDHLIKQETVQDKGHVFKSLHTSGLVPPQGKVIADKLDGIWVSGGGALMSRPRARLGVIAYWLVLHLWLVGTLL